MNGHGGKRPGAGRKPKHPKPPTAHFTVIEGGIGESPPPAGVPEPDWSLIYSDELTIARARNYWRDVIRELQDSEKLAAANLHSVKRLVAAYLVGDQAIEKLAETGPVIKGKRGGLISNPWLDALKDANNMASTLEAELTITPRRRNNGGKVSKKRPAQTGAAAYLRSVGGK